MQERAMQEPRLNSFTAPAGERAGHAERRLAGSLSGYGLTYLKSLRPATCKGCSISLSPCPAKDRRGEPCRTKQKHVKPVPKLSSRSRRDSSRKARHGNPRSKRG